MMNPKNYNEQKQNIVSLIPRLALITALPLVAMNVYKSVLVTDGTSTNIQQQNTPIDVPRIEDTNKKPPPSPMISNSTSTASTSSSTKITWKEILKPFLRYPKEVESMILRQSMNVSKDTAYIRKYRKEFNVINEKAIQITHQSFCLDWSVPSDLWWTHHCEWELYNETDAYYCYNRIIDSERSAFLTALYNNQFGRNCSTQIPFLMINSGWSADLKHVVLNLHKSIYAKRPLQINMSPWHYAAPDEAQKGNKGIRSTPACPTMNMNCYFLDISHCTQLNRTERVRARDLPGMPKKDDANDHTNKWLREYLTRPRLWLRTEIYKFVQNQTIRKPCTAIHVRRSDVVLHYEQSRKYRPIEDYVDASTNQPNFELHDNILLLTDDANAIGEAKALFPQYNWMYIDRPRWKADKGGWEHHLPSSQPKFEMVVLQSTFRIIQKCDSLIRTDSGFGNWLEDALKEKTKKNIRNDAAKIINLDQGLKVRDFRHQRSRHVSKNYDTPSTATLTTKNVSSTTSTTTATTAAHNNNHNGAGSVVAKT